MRPRIAPLFAFACLLLAVMPAAAEDLRQPPDSAAEAARALAPSGRLKVAINLGNGVLAQRNAATGELGGVSVVIAKAIGERLHVPVDFIAFDAAGKVFDALDQGQWDLAFLAIEPERAARIDFSPPYVFIDGTYLVRRDSRYRSVNDLDRSGAKIAVGRGAAYDLFLSRTLHKAELVRTPTSPAAIALFLDDKTVDAAAGVRQALLDAARGRSDVRVLDDRYTRIDQAVAVPKGRDTGAAFVRSVLEQLKASGRIRAALDATHQDGAIVAPPAR